MSDADYENYYDDAEPEMSRNNATDKGPPPEFNKEGAIAAILDREFSALDDTSKARIKAREMAARAAEEQKQRAAAAPPPCPSRNCDGKGGSALIVAGLALLATAGVTYFAWKMMRGASAREAARAVARPAAAGLEELVVNQ